MPTRIQNALSILKQDILDILDRKLASQQHCLNADILASAELLNETRKNLLKLDKTVKSELDETQSQHRELLYEQGYFKKGNSDILAQIQLTKGLVLGLIEQLSLAE